MIELLQEALTLADRCSAHGLRAEIAGGALCAPIAKAVMQAVINK